MMQFYELLDSLPVVGVYFAYTVVAIIVSEGGFRLGRWRKIRETDDKDGPTNMIVGSILGLLGFLLAITMGMASDRFDKRRELVLSEANTIGTTYLRAGYLPEPDRSEIRNLLRQYVPLRIVQTQDYAVIRGRITRSIDIHGKLWSITEELARNSPESDVLVLFIDSLNEMIDLHETRETVGIYARVPKTIISLLIIGSMIALTMVGYNAGISLRRSPISSFMLILLLGSTVTLVIDLDRSQGGFLKVSQRPLLDLMDQTGASLPDVDR